MALTNTTISIDENDSTGNGSSSSYMPLILSSLAGLSTCLGAAIVFLVDQPSSSSSSTDTPYDNNKSRKRKRRKLGPDEMCFSLALAASVMITVSFASILPESFTDDNNESQWISISSSVFWERIVYLGAGGILFYTLSKCAFMEPDEILGFDNNNNNNYDSNSIEGTNSIEFKETKSSTNSNEKKVERIILHDRQNSDSSTTSGSNNSWKSQTIPLQRKRTNPGIIQSQNSFDQYDIMEKQQPNKLDEVEPLLLSTTAITESQKDNNDSPHQTKPKQHERTNEAEISCWTTIRSYQFSGSDLQTSEARRAWRVTMLLFVSLAIHNFPEGLAVAASTIYNVKLGWTTTIAIALHNIPEGIAIAIPCLAARPDSPWLAFGLASLSGLAEPFGAAVAMLFIDRTNSTTKDNHTGFSMKNVLSFVAGIMIMVAILDLYPESLRHSKPGNRLPLVLGTAIGVIIMLASEAYLNS